jgi:hypothetical protein
MAVTAAARFKKWTVFARSNAGIVGSNPTQGMGVCLCLFCVRIGTGWSPIQGVLPTVLGLRNWSEIKRFTDVLCFKVGARRKRERHRLYESVAVVSAGPNSTTYRPGVQLFQGTSNAFLLSFGTVTQTRSNSFQIYYSLLSCHSTVRYLYSW